MKTVDRLKIMQINGFYRQILVSVHTIQYDMDIKKETVDLNFGLEDLESAFNVNDGLFVEQQIDVMTNISNDQSFLNAFDGI